MGFIESSTSIDLAFPTSDNRLPHGNAALCATRLHTSGFLACQSRDMGEPRGMAGAGSSAGQSDEELAVARVVKTYSPPGVVARLRFITREARDGARRQAYLRLIDTIQQHTCSVDMYTVRPCVGAWGLGAFSGQGLTKPVATLAERRE